MSLLDNLVSYWPMSAASGGESDAHGANSLSQTGSVGTAAGVVGTARDFSGAAGNYFSHADNPDLATGDTDWTFAGWAWPDVINDYKALAGKDAGATQEWRIYARTASPNIQVFFAGPSGSPQPVGVTSLTLGAWNHVVVWHDSVNNLVGIGINGGAAVTASLSGGLNATAGAFYLGHLPSFGAKWDGRIDEVGWWRRVLTPAERAELYNGGAGLAYPFTPPATTVPALCFPGAVGSFPGLVFGGA